MNMTYYISESLETFFWVKNTSIFDADPGSGIFLTWIRDGKIRIRDQHPDPQH
jgi:hypothetical protein